MLRLTLLLAMTASCMLLTACPALDANTATDTDTQSSSNTNTSDPISKNNIIVDKEYYQILYNTDYKGAVKVSYKLNKKKIDSKNIKKRPRFYNEKLVPKEYQTTQRDYTNTGYDRGHLANDASFDWSKGSQLATYSMANIVPMLPIVNRGSWLVIEDYERDMAKELVDIEVDNIITYKNDHLLTLQPLDSMLEKANFKTKASQEKYVQKYKKSAEKLAEKRIHLPIGFYKVITAKDKNFKECFYVENTEASSSRDRTKYLIDCNDVPKI